MYKLWYLFLCVLFLTLCDGKRINPNNNNSLLKVISLQKDVNIVIPVIDKDFNDSLTYTHIEIWIDSKLVFKDTTLTEYIFGDRQWPQVRKLKTGEYEVLISVFDAPDFNKIRALYFRNDSTTRSTMFPYFNDLPKDYNNDGKKEYVGIMNIADAYENNDSCYYNPALYYEISEWGIKLDSVLTIEMNKKSWGVFLGFYQKNIPLPCPVQ
jgi:hypothetical protein